MLITITLVAFLVLILVSLATLTRVETQVAANSQQLAQARGNALMALNIAIGQLQKYAGPDQRVTARADLENGAGVNNTHWVGAYGSSLAPDYDATPSALQTAHADSSKVAANGSSAKLLNWLVSGNERVLFDPTPAGGDVGSKGEILNAPAAGAITFLPTASVSGLDATTHATDLDLTISDSTGADHPARVLLGQKDVATTAGPSGTPIDFVVAPAVDIKTRSDLIPGLGSGSDITIGRYAWWAGDEGIKARVNLPIADTLEDKQIAFTNATRSAVELMARDTPGWSATPAALDATRIDTLYAPDSTRLSDIIEKGQLPLTSGNPAALSDALKLRFHDVTSRSMSVLSDTYAGGLRQDLTHILEVPTTGPASTNLLWEPDNAAEDTSFIPTWGHLRSFETNTTDSSGKIQPRLPSYGTGLAGDTGVSPVMTYVALGFRYNAATVDSAPPNYPVPGSAINFDIHPIVVLWNPYDKVMAGHTYGVGMGFLSSDPRLLLQVNQIDTSLPSPPDNWQTREIRDLRLGGATVASGAPTGGVLKYFRFRVVCPDIPPGQSLVFTLQNSGGNYAPGTATLIPGVNPHHHVTLSSTTIAAGEEDLDYRVVGQGGMNSNHHVAAYLGDGTAPPNSAAGAWDPLLNRWYQTVQHVDYAGVNVSAKTGAGDTPANAAIYGDAAPLDTANPVYEPQVKALLMSVFSSIGKGYTLTDQYGQNIPRYRWIAQANIRAPYQFRSRRDPNMNTPWYAKIGNLSSMWPTWYLQSASTPERASSGLGLDYDLRTGGVIDATLFEVRDDDQELLSVGQLQHANLSLASAYPSYAVGNAIADFRLPLTNEVFTSQGVAASEITNRQFRYYDASWLLNRTLWDRYYFSGVQADGSLLNPRMISHRDESSTAAEVATDLQDYRKSAARLLISGGFNINSTSEQAWRAVLGGLNQLAYDPEANNGKGANSTTSRTTAAFPRFSRPLAGTGVPSGVAIDPSFNGNESQYAWFRGDDMQSLWQGYRTLDENQIAQLARNVVDEIRARGPFTSLGDFVNRRLVNTTAYMQGSGTTRGEAKPGLTNTQRRLFLSAIKGTLQSAIDATYAPATGAYPINELSNDSYWNNNRTMSSLQGGDTTYYSLALARGDINDSSNKTPSRSTAAFAPKYLTQADVLSAIGSGLSARSDTFTIRAYGETVNPLDQTVEGRAWCEAVVQRMPEYIDSQADAPETAPSALTSSDNQKYGRQYKIVSFRWLSPDEI
ncbi:MAG: hypothetical protein ABII82_17640 [Verrucomicrobiota bacterium]